MPNYPEPGNLANPNGVTFTGVAALPGGVVYGRDGQVIREMLAAVSTLLYGDAVILAPSIGIYHVTTTSITDDPLRYGVIVGGQVSGAAASAASVPVWVATDGVAWGLSGASISAGMIVGTTSLGRVGAVGQSTGLNGQRRLAAYGATVSFATSITSTGGGVYTIDVAVTQGAPFSSLDSPIAFVPAASLPENLGIAAVWASTSNAWGIRMFGANVSTTIASQASIPGTLFTARAGSAVAGGILGTVLASVSAVSVPVLLNIEKR